MKIISYFLPTLILLKLTPSLALDFGVKSHTFEIKEQSFSSMMLEKLSKVDIDKHNIEINKKIIDKAQNPASTNLPRCKKSASHIIDPSIELNQDIKDHNGKVLFKAGTKINPLSQISIEEIVLINGNDKEQIAWYKQKYKDKVNTLILLGGNYYFLKKSISSELYFDQTGEWVKKFKIESLPAILSQKYKIIRVHEINIDEANINE
jgi:conjugal transfer pilus assembly protein TraW